MLCGGTRQVRQRIEDHAAKPMATFPQPEPLTDAELNGLGDFLKSCKGGRAMNVEALDGFFAALIAGPETVMPSEYYREVFGGEMSDACEFSSLDEANEILGLMMRHWNGIAGTLFKCEVYVPLLLEDENGVARGNDWARGFMRGMGNESRPSDCSIDRERGRNLQELPRLGKQRSTCSSEGVGQRLLRELLDDRFDDPSQPKGHVTRQRDGPTLNIHTTFPLLESPVGIQPPQKSGTGIGWQHSLPRASGVLHFTNPGRVRATDPAPSIQRTIMHLMIGIKDDRHNFLLEKS